MGMGYAMATIIAFTMLMVDGETAFVTAAGVAAAGAGIGQFLASRTASKA